MTQKYPHNLFQKSLLNQAFLFLCRHICVKEKCTNVPTLSLLDTKLPTLWRMLVYVKSNLVNAKF